MHLWNKSRHLSRRAGAERLHCCCKRSCRSFSCPPHLQGEGGRAGCQACQGSGCHQHVRRQQLVSVMLRTKCHRPVIGSCRTFCECDRSMATDPS